MLTRRVTDYLNETGPCLILRLPVWALSHAHPGREGEVPSSLAQHHRLRHRPLCVSTWRLRVLLDATGEVVYQPACNDHLWRDASSWGLFPVGSLLEFSPFSVTLRAFESDMEMHLLVSCLLMLV